MANKNGQKIPPENTHDTMHGISQFIYTTIFLSIDTRG